ncbi:DUF1642 domain-containing protein [Streptococcus suis]|nr:DUF1642 domain-containing protein [Streptococcus suis]
MNKQEAIEEIYTASWDSPDYEGLVVKVETVNEIISQIHEPQKAVVPKFVAEWIEEHKAQFSNLYTVYSWLGQQKNQVSEWVNSNIDIFARAWLDGFEIEQEKLYTVELFNGQPLVEVNNVLYFDSNLVALNASVSKDKLEQAGFGWVFDCDGVKVVEVE